MLEFNCFLNMKTVTVTHHKMNYGAVLQAYAFQQQLKKIGIEDKLLDITVPFSIFSQVKLNKHLPGNVYNNILNLIYLQQTKARMDRFREFIAAEINSTRNYESVEKVIENPPEADVYITGSDQMFNTSFGVRANCFLKFGDKNIRRISYATSLGRLSVQGEYIDEFISAIKQYSYISLREKCSCDYITRICGVECFRHIDPSLLLSKEEWMRLAMKSKYTRNSIPSQYVLVYCLFQNPLVDEVLRKIKQDTGLKVVVVTPYSLCKIKGDVVIRDAGPVDFLKLFMNAEYVITTSFHGTCFSVIFEKKFFSFIRKEGEVRINGILNLLGLSDRILTDLKQISYDDIVYDPVNKVLQTEREKSIEYLTRALDI